MSDTTAKKEIIIGNKTGVTQPVGRAADVKANAQRTMPCVTILIHGVNDVGEAYSAQEKGICEGLNDRLARADLRPAAYKLPRADRKDALPVNPDVIFFRRLSDTTTNSPVVPFYWGFREVTTLIHKTNKHGEWTDALDNRLDKDGAKNGGPFANATNNLRAMFGAGFNGKTEFKISADGLLGQPVHHMVKGPDRHYMVLAAKRLAMVITVIRKKYPDDTINIVAHSQGTMVTLLAHVYLEQEGTRGADCVIFNNSPYSLEVPPREADGTGIGNDGRQTLQARLNTLAHIVKSITSVKHATPPLPKPGDANQGLTGNNYGKRPDPSGKAGPLPFTDRDNRGKVYLYFSEYDMTTALDNMRSIGWCGVPDYILMPNPSGTDGIKTPALGALGPNFRQRIFTLRERNGEAFKVGVPDKAYCMEKWNEWSSRTSALLIFSRGDIADPIRNINGEALTPPVKAELLAGEVDGKLAVSPIDAANAIAAGGIRPLPWKYISYQRPKGDVLSNEGALEGNALKNLEKFLNKPDTKTEDWVTVRRALVAGGDDRYSIECMETPNEARMRWQSREMDENSRHSGIVSSVWNSRNVTAYDLAIGQGLSVMDQPFMTFLCLISDWRMKRDDFARTLQKTSQYQATDAATKAIIGVNVTYYTDGFLPPEISAATPPKQIVDQTMDEQSMAEYKERDKSARPHGTHPH
ncbi:MAG TPA: hypothetical protein DCW29_00285 [Janthinobacterium sp.]|nr:hypothetical protein [Janthinobacterium sp.]